MWYLLLNFCIINFTEFICILKIFIFKTLIFIIFLSYEVFMDENVFCLLSQTGRAILLQLGNEKTITISHKNINYYKFNETED